MNTIQEDHLEHALERQAKLFAYAAHAATGQKRRYTDEPYINHPAAVAELVRHVGGHTAEMLAAAWLHDVVEDTRVTIDQIGIVFGPHVRRLVWYLTDISKPEDGNRAARKAKDREHIALAGYEAQTVKLADLIDNARDIQVHDKDFAKVYMAEKRELLKVLTNGDQKLLFVAETIVENYFAAQKGPPS